MIGSLAGSLAGSGAGSLARLSGIPLVLDNITAAGAYGCALKPRTAYSGAAIRVRRDSNGDELDIGFVGGELDVAELINHCTGANGFVTAAYDLSGNGRNLTQATAANQPKIFDSVTGVLRNGVANRPCMLFDGTDFLARADAWGFAGAPAINSCWNWQRTALSADSIMVAIGPGTANNGLHNLIFNGSLTTANSTLFAVRAFTANPASTTWSYYISSFSAGQLMSASTIEQNGVALAQSALLNGGTALTIQNTAGAWGAFASGSNGATGRSSSLILTPSVLAGADLTAMRTFFASMA